MCIFVSLHDTGLLFHLEVSHNNFVQTLRDSDHFRNISNKYPSDLNIILI